jgi:transposase
MDSVPVSRRRHSAELKARILEACEQPGASVARIAMEHGINANVVHKWRQRASGRQVATHAVSTREFVPVSVLPPVESAPAADIRIAIRRGGTTVDIQWPAAGAEACAQWLRDLLR